MTEEASSDGPGLYRSRIRIDLLQRLRNGDATKYDLREEFDCARTTIDRNLDRLAADGWITQSPDGYAITTSGELVIERMTDFLETVETASRLQPILQWIPREELGVDVRHLSDAELTLPGEVTPVAMVDRHTEELVGTLSGRLVLPLVSPHPIRAYTQNDRPADSSLTAVVTPAVAEVFDSDPQFADMIEELRASGVLRVYVTGEPVPYYLGLLDGTVQIGVDDDGEMRGLLECEAAPVREWAEEKFEAYRASAEPFDEWERS